MECPWPTELSIILFNIQVNVEMVMKTLSENGKHAVQLLLAAVPLIAQMDWTDTIKDLQVYRVSHMPT